MTETKTPATIYRELRADGMRQADACYQLMDMGVTSDDAADLCWRIETGAPAPKWEHEDGTPTQAALEWSKGADQQGEE